jgi:hypothetical protein
VVVSSSSPPHPVTSAIANTVAPMQARHLTRGV